MGLVDKLVGGLFAKPQPIATRAELADFMDSRAAFLAQKCVVEFCRVRAGVYWQKLFSEKEFQAELDLSRWRAYPPAFTMVAEMVEGALREAAGIRQRHLPEKLGGLAGEVFARYPVPPRRGPGLLDARPRAGRQTARQDPGGSAAAGARTAQADGARRVQRAALAQGHRHQRLRLHLQQSADESSQGARGFHQCRGPEIRGRRPARRRRNAAARIAPTEGALRPRIRTATGSSTTTASDRASTRSGRWPPPAQCPMSPSVSRIASS